MERLAGYFMKAAVLYALAGFTIGLAMGATHNFGMTSVHVHLSVIGWLTMAVFAMYYHLVPVAARNGAAKAHFWIANAGVLILTASLALLVSGVSAAEAGAAIGSIITVLSLLIFAYIVFKTA
ncbi:hypothetical protein KJ039_08940 [bacterium]|nr:hypothetical protein [bacterium]